jgi:predicted glycosyltransferase
MGIRNYRLFPDPKLNFPQSLAACAGVISNAGHQIICESVYLQKPVFVLPLRGQYEQHLNGVMLERSGWGMMSGLRTLETKLKLFIEHIDHFPASVPAHCRHRFDFSDCTEKAVQKIHKAFSARRTTKQCAPIRSALPAAR